MRQNESMSEGRLRTNLLACPHCGEPLVLPDELLGPWGARVTCPSCREAFLVPRDGELLARRARREVASDADPAVVEALAARILEDLDLAASGAAGGPETLVEVAVDSANASANGVPAKPESDSEPAVAVAEPALAAHEPVVAADEPALAADGPPAWASEFEAFLERAGVEGDLASFRNQLEERWRSAVS
jgi:hypothetical protein